MMSSLRSEIAGRGSILDIQERLDQYAKARPSGALMFHEDLAGLDLSMLEFGAYVLDSADLRGIRAHETTFPQLVRCDLSGARCYGASLPPLIECKAIGAECVRCVVASGARCSDFSNASLWGCIMHRPFRRKTQDPGHCLFIGSRLDALDACGAILPHSDFRRASLREARLSRANLVMGKFDEVDLSGANLIDAKLEGASFAGAVWSGALLSEREWTTERRGAKVVTVRHDVLTSLTHLLAISHFETMSWEFSAPVSPFKQAHRIEIDRYDELRVLVRTMLLSPPTVRRFGTPGEQSLEECLKHIATDYANWTLEENSFEMTPTYDSDLCDEVAERWRTLVQIAP